MGDSEFTVKVKNLVREMLFEIVERNGSFTEEEIAAVESLKETCGNFDSIASARNEFDMIKKACLDHGRES